MADEGRPPLLSELLDEYEWQLQSLARRQFVTEAFIADLDKVTRGQPFRIRNDALWLMLLDTRDTLVVHLASCARGVYQPGGLFGKLQASHARDLPRKRPPGPYDDDPSFSARRDREHATALDRLFPTLSNTHPRPEDFDQLRAAFVEQTKAVVDDRSANRAHPFERQTTAGTVKMLGVSELRDAISYSEGVLNDLSMVGCHRHRDYREMNTPIAADVVPDMVDALLLGPPERVVRLRDGLDRIAFYDELHHRHAARPSEPDRYFNDRLFRATAVVEAGAIEVGAGSPTRSEPRYVGFFPALPLGKNIELDEWIIGTPPADTPWASTRFRELSETLVRSFCKLGFSGGAMLWHRDHGFNGSKPSDNLIAAIHAAVTFAALDANDRLRLTEPDDGNKGWDFATTENAELFIQSIDEEGGITHRRGGALKSTLVGGLTIGGEPPPIGDAVQPIRQPVQASRTLARELFSAVRVKNYAPVPPIAVAAEWHRSALANPPAVTMEQRLIALKTGFEALFNTSSSGECARKLRALFNKVTRPHRDLLPWSGLLWTPNERSNLWRWFWLPNGRRQIERRDEIEDWFKTLADARNEVIHRGNLARAFYDPPPERPLSRYVGPLLWVGERMLREAIKARLGAKILLGGALAHRAWMKATFGPEVRELIKQARANPPPPAPPEPPPRSLDELLSALNCPAANLVTIGRLMYPGPITDEAGVTYDYAWGADYGEHSSMIIRNAERDLLTAAGAEEEIPDALFPSD